MRLDIKTPDDVDQIIASRWKLTLHELVAQTRRARIFKVTGPEGVCALKLYNKVGFSGEGAAVHFLRGLDPGIGVKVHRVSNWRAAVLMEWLDGPTLGQILTEGNEAEATALLGGVAQAVTNAKFKYPFIYRRVVPGLKKDFANCVPNSSSDTPHPDLARITSLLDHLSHTSPKECVIHGDLGFDNVVLTENGPRLFDPKGFRADPAFELAKGLVIPYDHMSRDDLLQRIETRGPVLAKAIGTTPIRLIQWAAVILGHKVIYGARKTPAQNTLQPHLTALLEQSTQ